MKKQTVNTFEGAKNKAMNLLSYRMHTKKELTDKLLRSGIDEQFAFEAADWAQEYGFINDEEYARTFISDCINIKKYGIRRIKQALLFKGIDAYTIEDVLSEFEFDESEALVSLVKKKLGGNFERKNIDKTVRHFAGKGYSFSDIKSGINKIKDYDDEGDF